MGRRVDKKYVYHLNLDEEKIQGARYAFLPGDPFRCQSIAHAFDQKSTQIAWKREYCTWLGRINGIPVLVTSTGIGGPSTSIAIDELAQLGVRTFIRVGTTGAIQPYIDMGDVIITSGSVRLDGASTHYAPIEYPAVAHFEVINALVQGAIAEEIKYHVGITLSSDTFYPGQERKKSFTCYVPRRFQEMTKEWKRLNVLNYEMESSTVLTLCSAMGLRGGCVTGVIDQWGQKEDITPEDLKLGENNATRVAVRAMNYLIEKG